MENSRLMNIEIDLSDYVDEVKSFVSAWFYPEDVFSESVLSQWAETNGYKKETDDGR